MPHLLTGPSLPPFAGGAPEALVVLLHGLGADADDLFNLAGYWRTLLPGAEFVSLNAPFACDFAPDRRQWFSVADRSPAALLAGAREAARTLDPTLDALISARGLAPGRLALVGFSQGAMMALHVGLRREEQVGAIAAFSGALRADILGAELRSRPPVLLVHGEEDAIVPFAAMGEALASLRAAGVPATALARPGLGHSVDEVGLGAAGRFLQESL